MSLEKTAWSPERKVVGAAVATLIMAITGIAFPELDVPIGVEGAVAVLVAYLVPSRA